MAPGATEDPASARGIEGPPTKRRRIAIACSTCRTRKSKCDGHRPACATCQAQGLDCEYETSEPSNSVILQKAYLSNLEDRLKQAEEALNRHDGLLLGHLAARATSTKLNSARRTGIPGNASQTAGISIDASGVEDYVEEDARTDGLAVTFINENASAFYGESSNVAFSRYLLQAASKTLAATRLEELAAAGGETSVQGIRSSSLHETLPLALETHNDPNLRVLTLPECVEMESLLNVYFTATGSLFPFIHELTFRKTYREFKATGFTKVRRTWLGLLNMILAMASNMTLGNGDSDRERHKRSHIYYARAVVLCDAPSRFTISIEIVQHLLLMVLYLQGAQRSTQTWSAHGLLVRTATALGLHSEKAGQRLDPVQRETRRRTWLTIYCLDKVLSVTFGRPPSIQEDHMTVLPAAQWPTSTGPSASGPSQAASQDLSADVLNTSVALYKIMGRSVVKQYNSNLGWEDKDIDIITTVQSVSEMRQDLKRWVSALPSHFGLCSPGSHHLLEGSTNNRLRNILTLRYHNLNILIHRPLLCTTLRFLSNQNTSYGHTPPYTVQLAMAEAQECISSAESTIEIVHSVLTADHTSNNNLGVWFFTLYYVFTASLVICSRDLWIRCGIDVNKDNQTNPGCSHLTKAAEALDLLDSDILLVQNCAKYIRHLSKLQHSHLQSRCEDRDCMISHSGQQPADKDGQQFLANTRSSPDMVDLGAFMENNAEASQFFGMEGFDDSFWKTFDFPA